MTQGKGQAPDSIGSPGPGSCLVGECAAVRYWPAAAFAAMSVRCWEPSRRMRPTAW